MKKIILFSLLILPLQAEIEQIAPKEKLEDLPFWHESHVMEGEVTKPDNHFALGVTWDQSDENPEFPMKYVQLGQVIKEGEEGWRDWEDDNPDNPIWRITEIIPPAEEGGKETRVIHQVRVTQAYPITKAAEQAPIPGAPIMDVSREARVFIPEEAEEDKEYTVVIRYIVFKDANGANTNFQDDWTTITTGDWSDFLVVKDQGERPPKPTGLKQASEFNAPVVIEIESSKTMEEGTWETRMVYIPSISERSEFFRFKFNESEIQQ